MSPLAEAAMLGLASGPACLASCGPVLIPSLAAGSGGPRAAAGALGVFLAGRLAGYLCFALLAWTAGLAAPAEPRARALLFGLVEVALAILLVAYALTTRRRAPAPASRLVTIGERVRPAAPAALGLVTGLSLCPPFLAAGARAAQASDLPSALLFFLVFFLGTAVWTMPLLGVGWVNRRSEVATVARITLFLLAAWYACRGAISLTWRFSHG